MSDLAWAIPTPATKWGLDTHDASGADPSPTHGIAVSHETEAAWWHWDNPLVWFGAIAAAAVGLMGLSVHGRVGPLHASAGAGKA